MVEVREAADPRVAADVDVLHVQAGDAQRARREIPAHAQVAVDPAVAVDLQVGAHRLAAADGQVATEAAGAAHVQRAAERRRADHRELAARDGHAPRGVQQDLVVAVVVDADVEDGVLAALRVVANPRLVAAATPPVLLELEADGVAATARDADPAVAVELDLVGVVVHDPDLQPGVLAALAEVADPRVVPASAPAVVRELEAQRVAAGPVQADATGRVQLDVVVPVVHDPDLQPRVLAALRLVADPRVVPTAAERVVGPHDAVVAAARRREHRVVAATGPHAPLAVPAHDEVAVDDEVAAAADRHAAGRVEHDVVVGVVADADLEARVLAALAEVADPGVVAAAAPAVVGELEPERVAAGAVEGDPTGRVQLDVVVPVVHVADLQHGVLTALREVADPRLVAAAPEGVGRPLDAGAARRGLDHVVEHGPVRDGEEAPHPQVAAAGHVDAAGRVQADVVVAVVGHADVEAHVLAAVRLEPDPRRVTAAAEGVGREDDAVVSGARGGPQEVVVDRDAAAEARVAVGDPEVTAADLEVGAAAPVEPVARGVRAGGVLEEDRLLAVEAQPRVLRPGVQELEAGLEAAVADLDVVTAHRQPAAHVGRLADREVAAEERRAVEPVEGVRVDARAGAIDLDELGADLERRVGGAPLTLGADAAHLACDTLGTALALRAGRAALTLGAARADDALGALRAGRTHGTAVAAQPGRVADPLAFRVDDRLAVDVHRRHVDVRPGGELRGDHRERHGEELGAGGEHLAVHGDLQPRVSDDDVRIDRLGRAELHRVEALEELDVFMDFVPRRLTALGAREQVVAHVDGPVDRRAVLVRELTLLVDRIAVDDLLALRDPGGRQAGSDQYRKSRNHPSYSPSRQTHSDRGPHHSKNAR